MSAFSTAPGVPPIRLEVYPKRHGHSSFPRDRVKATRADVIAEAVLTDPSRDFSYSDFFATPSPREVLRSA